MEKHSIQLFHTWAFTLLFMLIAYFLRNPHNWKEHFCSPLLHAASMGSLSLTDTFICSSKEIKRIPGKEKHQMSCMCLPLAICLKAQSIAKLPPWGFRIAINSIWQNPNFLIQFKCCENTTLSGLTFDSVFVSTFAHAGIAFASLLNSHWFLSVRYFKCFTIDSGFLQLFLQLFFVCGSKIQAHALQ